MLHMITGIGKSDNRVIQLSGLILTGTADLLLTGEETTGTNGGCRLRACYKIVARAGGQIADDLPLPRALTEFGLESN